MDSWFREIRESTSRSMWSRGVEIARGEQVRSIDERDDRALLQIRVAAGERAPRVTLFFEDASWDCDCGGLEDPCEHVAAAAIAWRRARSEGNALPSAAVDAAPPLRYELQREAGGLSLRRFVQEDSAEAEMEPLHASLRAIARGRVAGPAFEAEEADWEIDEILGDRHAEPLPRGVLPHLLRMLRGRTLGFEGHPVDIAAQPLRARVTLDDAPGGFRLRLLPATAPSELVAPGLAMRGDLLHEVDEGSLSGREREELLRGRFFPDELASVLAVEVVPDLEGRVTLDIRSTKLPRSQRVEVPRMRVTTDREGGSLVVQADILYGDPPRARLEGATRNLVSLGGMLPVRDQKAEAALASRIQQELSLPVGTRLELKGEEAFEVAQRLQSAGVPVEGHAHRDFFLAAPLHFALGEPGAFAPGFESGDEVTRSVSAPAVLDAWERGESVLALDGGGFAPLPDEWLKGHARILSAFLEARGSEPKNTQPRAFALPDWAALCEVDGKTPPSACESFRARIESFGTQPTSTPTSTEWQAPEDFQGTLREYQSRGVRWLCALRDAELGALLADDMGLGKTLQVLCALRGRSLVVAPTSVLANWREEVQRFRPHLRVCTYHGAGRRLDPQADLTLTSYAILRRDAYALCAVEWDTAVLDEAQNIKNPDSQAARAAFALRARFRVSMTGTPVENRLDELWSQLHFLNPGHMGTRARFAARYAKPIAAGEEVVAAELRRRIAPFVMRRLKSEVAKELPPRTDLVLRVDLDERERSVYDALRLVTRRDLSEQIGSGPPNVVAALEALLRLRQAACHTGLVPGQDAESSSKVDLLIERLETAVEEGHKALVFSQWTALLDRIEPALRRAQISFARLDGSTANREHVVASFQSDDGPPVFLVSLRAGGTGLNLTAADHVFLMDPWWNPAVEEQAADRAHRIGQDKPVFFHRLVAVDSVEEKILALQERKRSTAKSALAVAGSASALSREELLALLE